MTWPEWMTARQLLFEERIGTLLRHGQRAQQQADDRLSAEYRRSVMELKRRQEG